MHRTRRMGKGEKLKSRMHRRKPRTRRSPVLLVGSIIVKYRLMFWYRGTNVMLMSQVVDVQNIRHLRGGCLVCGIVFLSLGFVLNKLVNVISVAGQGRSTHKTSGSSSSKGANAYVHSTSTPHRQ